MVDDFPREWIEILIHMTGSAKRKRQGYRNYYAVSPNTPSHKALKLMQAAGLVTQYFESWGMIYFRATEKGCKAIRMTKTGMKRALNGGVD